ncbi:MAG TPA: winged helix-turn-helix domain-containing protein [Blastocatellia bacterium]|nr:winged helix-turn-helix domain-containing protein [Blastocatellia bacterium]
MNAQVHRIYEFGPFRIDPVTRQLRRDGQTVPLKPKVFDTLLVLVEHSGQVVSKDYLMQAIWPDTVVEENNLTQNISALRKILGEQRDEHRYIVTEPGRGYRFVAEVKGPGGGANDLIVGKLTRSRVLIEDELTVAENGQTVGQKADAASRKRKTRAALLAVSVLLAALAGALIYFFALSQSGQPQSGMEVRSIAVLPFQSLDPNEADPALGLKLADALITRLGRLQQIAVRSTRAVGAYEGQWADPLTAGRAQQVDVVLDGSFQRAGERLRVTVRLLRTSDGQQMWTGIFDERATDPLALQDALAEQTAQALVPRLTGAERTLVTRRDTDHVEAHRLYTAARVQWNRRNVEGIQKSVQLLERAVALDPKYARAHAARAESYITLNDYRLLPAEEAFPKAREAAQRALAIDDSLIEAHTALAMIKASYEWDWAGADRAFKQALEKNPHYATAHQWYAEFLSGMGRHEEALEHIRQAQQLEPLSLIIQAVEALVLVYARDYDGAIAQCQRVISRDPSFGEVYAYLRMAYEQKGMFREAMDAFQKYCALMGYDAPEIAALRASPVVDARDYWQKMLVLSRPPHGSELSAARAWAQLGETDKALAALEQVCAKPIYGIMYLKVHPNLDPLRSDPRFENLLRRVGLAQ